MLKFELDYKKMYMLLVWLYDASAISLNPFPSKLHVVITSSSSQPIMSHSCAQAYSQNGRAEAMVPTQAQYSLAYIETNIRPC